MSCTLEDERELWEALLALRAYLRSSPPLATTVFLARATAGWTFATVIPAAADLAVAIPLRAATAVAPSRADWHIVERRTGWTPIPREHAVLPPFLQVYLPIVLAALPERDGRRPHVTGHLAQTLDGRIACASGDSQWIGNAGNLRHAHRLRALHDAILVGRATVERDDPRLTVRHVSGPDPLRVVLNGSASMLRRQHELRVFAGAGCLLVCARAQTATAASNGSEVVALDPDAQGAVPIVALLAALQARGVRSLLVEGGGRTLSGFLAAGCIDLLHLHVAPIILGSGVPGFVLPAVERLADAQRVAARHFDVDGELLFACEPGVLEAAPDA